MRIQESGFRGEVGEESTALLFQEGRGNYLFSINLGHIRQQRPDSGLGLQIQILPTFSVVPSSLGRGDTSCSAASTRPGGYRGALLVRNARPLGPPSGPRYR